MTLSGGGTAAGAELTAEALANMSQAEFDSVMSKLIVSQQRALMGG